MAKSTLVSDSAYIRNDEITVQISALSKSCYSLIRNSLARTVCRAMLCIARLLPSPGVCLSVTFVSSAKTNKDIFEIFSPFGSLAILVFPYQTGWRYSNGASNARGYEKIDDFRPISRCISETVIVRWAHAARQFVSIKFPFHPYNI